MSRLTCALALGAALFAAACVPPPPQPAIQSQVAKGETLYAPCAGCHGQGSASNIKNISFSKMKAGMQMPAMAPWKDLSDDDIGALVAFLAAR
ncbi:MAG: cytochrome c [Candidatus Sericytochromatia bacterium]|nr:cytochrome c [Candidatus Tanganyikabacteria bacterium]